ncbi:MAG: OsmC family protein [Proteobacteria bacterium]|jgi:putative redox protein|nr:OsmC family protein [Pseudomonadota bacterium]
MPSEMTVHATYAGGMRVTATNGEHTLTTDYPLAPGEKAAGFRPMELILVALAACAGSAVGLLLGRMKQPMQGLDVNVRAERCDEHPTVFTAIAMEFVFRGAGLDPAAIERVIAQADDQLCPVWAMVKASTPITTTYRIVEAG